MKHKRKRLLILTLLTALFITSCDVSGSEQNNSQMFPPQDTYYRTQFVNDNGDFLYLTKTKKGATAQYDGPTPTKQATNEFTYEFDGWDLPLTNILKDTVFTATYATHVIYYHDIVFINYNDSILYQTQVQDGGVAVYEGPAPERPESGGFTYKFTGWNKPLANIKEPTVFVAQYEGKQKPYTVTFLDDEGGLLDIIYVYPGDTAYYSLGTPHKESSDEAVTYVFDGWDKPLTNIQEDTVVTAIFEKIVQKHTVRFFNYDSTLLYEQHVNHGEAATYVGEVPSRPNEGRYQYTFLAWDTNFHVVTGNLDIYPLYETAMRDFSSGLVFVYDEQREYYYIDDYVGEDSDVYVPYEYTTPEYGERPVKMIAARAFANNQTIRSVFLERNIEYIENEAFANSLFLESVTLPANLKKIARRSFYNTIIPKFIVPAGVSHIGQDAFTTDGFVPEVVIDETNAYYKLVDNVLMDKAGTIIYFSLFGEVPTHLTISEGVKQISDNAFAGNVVLQTLTLPSSLEQIGDGAFIGALSLHTVTFLDSPTVIGDSAFADAESLTNVSFGANIAALGRYAFANTALNDLVLPQTVKKLYPNSFENVAFTSINIHSSNLYYQSHNNALFSKDLRELLIFPLNMRGTFTIPEQTSNIDLHLFDNNNLSSFNVHANNLQYSARSGLLYTKNFTELLRAPTFISLVELHPSTLVIREYAFKNVSNVRVFTLNNNLKTIKYQSFKEANFLEHLVLPDSVEVIEIDAFANIETLQSVTFGANLATVASGAFSYTPNLTTVHFNNKLATIDSFTFYGSNLEHVRLGSGVRTIRTAAFGGIPALKTLELNAGLVTIENSAFGDTTGYEELVIPDSVTTIGDHAFINANELETLTLGANLRTIGSYAFAGARNLIELEFNDKLTTINEGAFMDNYSLRKVVMNDTISVINYLVFANAYALNELVFGAGVTTIRSYAFENAESLEILYLHAGITKIESDAFWGAMNLRTIVGLTNVLQPSVSISYYAFAETNVHTIYYLGQNANDFNFINDVTVYLYSEIPSSNGYWRYVNGRPVLWE